MESLINELTNKCICLQVAESEIKYPTPTFLEFPTPTFQNFRLPTAAFPKFPTPTP